MTQEQRVLDFMERCGAITSMLAYDNLGIVSLPKRISVLRRSGCHITAKTVAGRNRYGKKTHYNIYRLEGVHHDRD